MTNPRDQATKVLSSILYASLATTASDGTPWNAVVYVVYDENLHFYWASSKASQHSLNIQTNPQVSLAIYDSTVSWGQGTGVFILAEVVEVTDENEISKACQLRAARAQHATTRPAQEFMGDNPRRIYKAIPQKMWVNGDGEINGQYVDVRVEVEL